MLIMPQMDTEESLINSNSLNPKSLVKPQINADLYHKDTKDTEKNNIFVITSPPYNKTQRGQRAQKYILVLCC